MIKDLSEVHDPISGLFRWPESQEEWDQYRLSDEQIAFFHENGYLAGVRVLTDEQADAIVPEVDAVMNPHFEGNHLFHQYSSNESTDTSKILFHALGAWRIGPGLHD